VAVGLFTLALFAFLAAVYLTLESPDEKLREDFRRRALAAGVISGALAWLCLALAGDASRVRAGLTASVWAGPFHVATGAAALGALAALWRRAFRWARFLAAAQVALVMLGWALAQFPCLVPPDLTLWNAAAPATVRGPLLTALGLGSLLIFPCLAYLFYIFKREVLSKGKPGK
jgi:cytochrome d ubiquinol oxidase subunit II